MNRISRLFLLHPTVARVFQTLSFILAAFLAQANAAMAQASCPSGWHPISGTVATGAAGIIATMSSIFLAVQAVIYIIIMVGWLTGLVMWSAPSKSMIIKKGGQQQTEISGIALFLALMGPAIIGLIIWLAGQFGANAYCVPDVSTT